MSWGVWATRSANSVCGPGALWCKDSHGHHMVYDTEAEAKEVADFYQCQTTSKNLTYEAKPYEHSS